MSYDNPLPLADPSDPIQSIALALLSFRERLRVYEPLLSGLATFSELGAQIDALNALLDEVEQCLQETTCVRDEGKSAHFGELAEKLEEALAELDVIDLPASSSSSENGTDSGHPCCFAVGQTIFDQPPDDWSCPHASPSQPLLLNSFVTMDNDVDDLLERIAKDIQNHGNRLHVALACVVA